MEEWKLLLEELKAGGREEWKATIINGRVENVVGATKIRKLRNNQKAEEK